MLENFDFLPRVIFLDDLRGIESSNNIIKMEPFDLCEDMFSVRYKKGYLLDVGYIPTADIINGSFITVVVKDDFENTLFIRETRNLKLLESHIKEGHKFILEKLKYEQATK